MIINLRNITLNGQYDILWLYITPLFKVAWEKEGRVSVCYTLPVVKSFRFLYLFQAEECTPNKALKIGRIGRTPHAKDHLD